MELFRVNGLSSEDLMRPGHNPTKAFLGSMFKIGDQTPPPAAEGSVLEEADVPGDGLPTDPPADGDRWTQKDLDKLTKEKLVELGAQIGIADLTVTKPKLVEAILAAQ